jgi:threonine/homoserine/homoserine lactone efflux protein
MTIETILSLFAFSFVSSITPGPNNLMLMTSGTNFGFQKTIPHMLGVALGFSFMILVVGLGVAGLLQQWPTVYNALKVLCVAYMLWLAWKIAHAAAPAEKSASSKPFTFLQAAVFQWINPKAWSMALTAVTLYSRESNLHHLFVISGVFCLVNIPSVSSWALLGHKLRNWLSSPKHLRLFNWSMAILLVSSLALML